MRIRKNSLITFLVYMVAILACIATLPAAAQRPDIEINNSVLEDYEPPPMFGNSEKPQLSRPVDPDWVPQLTRDDLREPESADENLPSAEDLLKIPRIKDGISKSSVLKKETLQKKESPRQTVSVPLPPRKVEVAAPLIDVPLPVRKPEKVVYAPKPEKKTEVKPQAIKKQEPARPSLPVLARPKQVDVPQMPAIPAGNVRKEVLYTAPPEEQENDKGFMLEFEKGAAELQDIHKNTLDVHVALIMKNNKAFKLMLSAYALPADDTMSSARRISLSRALSVRSYLIERGVDPDRIEVRAMGSDTSRKPVDRIDLVFINTGN
jgi:outer membrane protein OmpA-like peptidoglycan-associated protein